VTPREGPGPQQEPPPDEPQERPAGGDDRPTSPEKTPDVHGDPEPPA